MLSILNKIKWLLAKIWFPFFIFENMFIKNNKKRLFVTTGNVSLVTALAIIKQTGKENDYEDYLVIESGGKKEFFERNIEMAKFHNFKNIVIVQSNLKASLVLANLFGFKEIYALNHKLQIPTIMQLYKDAEINLFAEGPGGPMMNLINLHSSNIKNFYMFKFLDKLDLLGFDSNINQINIDYKIFKEIANKINSKYSLDKSVQENEKSILFCANYWQTATNTQEQFVEELNEIITGLVSAGYTVLYKPHPRDKETYGFDKNPNVKFIDTVLPVELYDWKVLGIVSMVSSSSIMCSHYWGIPCFSDVLDRNGKYNKKVKPNLTILTIGEYSPNYKELLNFDVKNTNTDVLKNQIKEFYDNWVNKRPLFSENENIKNPKYD